MKAQYERFFIFSASRKGLSVNDNKQRTMEVARTLEESSLDFACVTGVYKGSTEASFFVREKEGAEELISTLCGLYNQECYLYRDNENNGFLVYPDSSREHLGKAREVTRQEAKELEAFTILPQADGTKLYFTFVKEQ